MKDAVWASLSHVASSVDKDFHVFYPKSSDSWCQYQRGPGLSRDVIDAIKPTYHDMSKDNILSKCLHGIPQNANESFNATL